ncbi:MAG: MerR family transcriptional regulator [Candidatus Limnocylindria bacterium]
MYTIKEAALRTGVSVALLRAWERRYGIVTPTRTEAGYRLYDDTAISRLRAMRALVDEGWSPRQAAERVASRSAAELRDETGEDGRRDPASTGIEAARLVAAAARVGGTDIERVLDDMFAAGSFERVIEDRLYPALVALGEAWARDDIDVAGEHAASAAALRRLGVAFEAAGRAGAGDAAVLVGLPPGSRHELPALAFATALRRAGTNTTYLGPDVPVDSWVTAVQRARARAVVIGVGMAGDVASAAAVITALHADRPDVLVAVGGRHAADLADDSVTHLPDRLGEAVEVLENLLARQ